jgi:two-component system sporulation sensor kinase C
MDYIYLSIIGAIAGTLSLILVYTYLYIMYRERYMSIWIIGWLTFFLRLVLFDSGIFNWKDSIIGFVLFQVLSLSATLLFLLGTYLLIDKPIKRWWLYIAATLTIVSIVLALMHFPFVYNLLSLTWFAGLIMVYIGKIYLFNLQVKGAGNRITGYAFILWGILTICMPYILSFTWLASCGYLLGGILRLIIASGTLIIYFEITRMDLAKKETQYRLLAENATDVIYQYKLPEANFEYISPSVLPVTGYTPEEYYADATLLTNLIHPDDLPIFNSLIKYPSLTGDLSHTFSLIRKDQSMIWIEQKLVPIYDKSGKLTSQVGILHDVTTRKNLEQIAARAARMNMVGEMAAIVAHEVRNPLTTVQGYLQMMSKNQELASYKNRFDLMIDELNRTNKIISEYLLSAKDKRSVLKNCCLNTIIKALSPLIQADASASNVCINLNLTDIPQLYLDENEIRQLLLNLVRNGVEAMQPSGGELAISTYLKQHSIILSVQDQGGGMSAHILNNLGTPFLTTKENGTGLGLPICYQIAKRHNATITIKTDSRGTTFFVSFCLPYLVA